VGVVESEIDGLRITLLREIADERGAVLHMLRADDPEFAGFGECYFSEVRPGVVKGWKLHLLQTQMFAVPVGRMKLVFFDDRPESSTRGTVQQFNLGRPDSYMRVRVPPGVWYAFGCSGQTPSLLVNCSDMPHDPDENRTLPLSTATIPYSWSLMVGSFS